MLMFTLTTSCLTMSSLPWFVDLTFQVPMQYYSLQHRTLLSPSDTSTTECHFCFDQAASLFLESERESRSVVANSLRPHGLYSPWNSPSWNTGVDSLSLLQGIFSAQGSNPGLPHCRQILYQLSQKGSPRILEWVAYPFSRASSWPRNQTGVSCIAGRLAVALPFPP